MRKNLHCTDLGESQRLFYVDYGLRREFLKREFKWVLLLEWFLRFMRRILTSSGRTLGKLEILR